MELILGVVIGAVALAVALMGRTLHVLTKQVNELQAQITARELIKIIPPDGQCPTPVTQPHRRRGAIATVTAIGTCTRHTFSHTIKRNRFAAVAAVATATATAVTVAALVVLDAHTSNGATPQEAGPPPSSAPDEPGPDRTPTPTPTPSSPTRTATPKTEPMGNDVDTGTPTPARSGQAAQQPAPPGAGERPGWQGQSGQAPAPQPTLTPSPVPTPSLTPRHCLKVAVSLTPRPGVRVCIR